MKSFPKFKLSPRLKRYLWAGFSLLIISGIVFSAVGLVRTYSLFSQVRKSQVEIGELRAFLSEPAELASPEKLSILEWKLKAARYQAETLKKKASGLGIWFKLASPLPVLGSYTRALPHLIDLTYYTLDSAYLTLQVYRPGVSLTEEKPSLAFLNEAITQNYPLLKQAEQSLALAQLSRAQLTEAPPRFQLYLKLFDRYSPLLSEPIQTGLLLPPALEKAMEIEQSLKGLSFPEQVDPFAPQESLPQLKEKTARGLKNLRELRLRIEPLSPHIDRLAKEAGVSWESEDLFYLLDTAEMVLTAALLSLQAAEEIDQLRDYSLLSVDFAREAEKAIPSAREKISQAQELLFRSRRRLEFLQAGSPPPLQSYLTIGQEKLNKVEELINTLDDLVYLFHYALGMDTPRKVILLGQDEWELRPTGGFIGALWELTIYRGVVTEVRFLNSPDVDDLSQPLIVMPRPFAVSLFGYSPHVWFFRDANWYPDFPSSARQAAALYQRGQQTTVDGIIAVTVKLSQDIVAVFGEIKLQELVEPITADLIPKYLQVEPPYLEYPARPEHGSLPSDRRFTYDLGEALIERFKQPMEPALQEKLAQIFQQALKEKDLQIVFFDQRAAAMLRKLNWDGGMLKTASDYLLVNEANMIGGKWSTKIERTYDYRIEISPQGESRATLTIKYSNSVPGSGNAPRQSLFGADGAYWAYVRVYTPLEANFSDLPFLPVPEGSWYALSSPRSVANENTLTVARREEWGKSELGFFFVVPGGQSQEFIFNYSLPSIVHRTEEGAFLYRLYLQKQAGVPPVEVKVTVILPPTAKLVGTNYTPADSRDNILTYYFSLSTDVILEVQFK